MNTFFDWTTPTPTPRPTAKTATANPIADRIEAAFDTASASTGTSFDYLVKTAQRESAMNPTAKAKTSSATGLFQFVESTWLETLKTSGPELGLQAVADKITADGHGHYSVADPKDRADILALRNDPEVASLMAGALTRRNAGYLAKATGREPSAGELYIAHFLGANGAAKLIRATTASPQASAADLFPRQAHANKSIFYTQGRERTVSEVYAELVRSHGGSDPLEAGATAVAAADGAAVSDDPASRVAMAFQASAPNDAFAALFRTDEATAEKPAAAAAFWRGYSTAPALFDVAVAEDQKALSAEAQQAIERDRESNATARGASIAARPGAPLDLSAYLKTARG